MEGAIYDLALDVSFFQAARVGDDFVVEDVHGSHADLCRREPGLGLRSAGAASRLTSTDPGGGLV